VSTSSAFEPEERATAFRRLHAKGKPFLSPNAWDAASARLIGCDGLFVPRRIEPGEIQAIVAAIDVPLNVMVLKGLPSVAELTALGVQRVSAGTGVVRAALAVVRRASLQFLKDGRYDSLFEHAVGYDVMNALYQA
jgi:2-methylisocitrate lyase-like PEP mutase family enzyme